MDAFFSVNDLRFLVVVNILCGLVREGTKESKQYKKESLIVEVIQEPTT